MLTEEINRFLDENKRKVIHLELDFDIVHNIIATLNETIREGKEPREIIETLIFCQTLLVYQTIDRLPECAFIYLRDLKEIGVIPDES